MTPEEAGKKWCPFAASRVVTGPTLTGPPEVATFGTRPTVMCLAGDCAAWVWSEPGVDGACGLVNDAGAIQRRQQQVQAELMVAQAEHAGRTTDV